MTPPRMTYRRSRDYRRGELIGFAQGNRSDHPEYAGELNKIYLLREYQNGWRDLRALINGTNP